MSDEQWKSVIAFAQFFLGTVVLGGFGTYINHQIQEREIEVKERELIREVEIKEQELISKHVATILLNKPADNLRMAQFYATVTRSNEIRARWKEYRNELQKDIDAGKEKVAAIRSEITPATDAKVADQKQEQIQKIKADITPGAKAYDPADTPPRVYFHIQNEAQREKAALIGAKLAENEKDTGLVVPGVELRANSPNSSEIRYFKPVDAIAAKAYAETLRKAGCPIVAKYVPGFESSDKLRPRHFEVWIAASWKPN